METGRIEPIKSHDLLVSLVSIQFNYFVYYEMASISPIESFDLLVSPACLS